MKLTKSLFAGAAILGFAATTRADITVYITGSTAFRAGTYSAISNLFTAGYKEIDYGNANAAKCNQNCWVGTISGVPGTVTISADWSGSVGGVRDVDTGVAHGGFINPAHAAGIFASVTTAANGTDASFYDQTPHAATIAMSDSFQSSTLFNATSLQDTVVGIVPFVWCKNNGSLADPHWANFTNVTDSALRTVLFGPVPLAVFTGSTNDWDAAHHTPPVYAVGRNDDSGTRLGAFADCGFGIFTQPKQFDITSVGGVAKIAIDTQVDGTGAPAPAGSQGYASGGNVATAMSIAGSANGTSTNTLGGTNWYALCYVGIPDSGSVVSGGGAILTYNGVAYTPANVQNGSYTFWGYEHVMGVEGISGDALTVYNDIANKLLTGNFETASGAGFEVSTMNVSRATDGSDPTHN